MKFSEVKGRQVVTLNDADKVGYIANAYVGSNGGDVAGFQVVMRGLLAGHRVFTWDSLSSIGADAVTIPGEEALHEVNRSPLADALSTESLIGAKVMAEQGEELGSIGDLDFDPGSGAINEYVLAPSLVERIEGRRETFSPSSIQSISGKMAVVADGAIQRLD
jgi:uncharacterized protein YrrD